MSKGEGFYYKGKNLTALILIKSEHVASIIAEKEGRPFEDCYRDFLLSKAYQNLIDTETLLWGESAEYIVDDYYLETVQINR
jgi:hypothetical protein